jgi:hypothetical protein
VVLNTVERHITWQRVASLDGSSGVLLVVAIQRKPLLRQRRSCWRHRDIFPVTAACEPRQYRCHCGADGTDERIHRMGCAPPQAPDVSGALSGEVQLTCRTYLTLICFQRVRGVIR